MSYSFFKNIIDRIFAVFLLIALSPLLLLISVLVKLFLGSPVIFRQLRPGYQGRPFQLLKFRTMIIDSGSGGCEIPDSVRLALFGRWLRATSMDELPELINIVRGEMSFVGPRPLLLQYLPLYTAQQFRRHDVMPGITGLAQISGRNQISWEEKFALDVRYVDCQSFWLDFRICLVTIMKVIRREGINASVGVTMTPFAGSISCRETC